MKTWTIAVFVSVTLVASGGEIADHFYTNAAQSFLDSMSSARPPKVVSTNHGITEIGIERTTCFGSCPAYTFIIKSDGTVRYKGIKFVERTGDFTGTIPVWYFHAIAEFIKDSEYDKLQEAYAALITDNPTTFTTVVTRGKRKTIRNYADSGPRKLWAVEELIDGLMAKTKWDGAPKPSAKGP